MAVEPCFDVPCTEFRVTLETDYVVAPFEYLVRHTGCRGEQRRLWRQVECICVPMQERQRLGCERRHGGSLALLRNQQWLPTQLTGPRGVNTRAKRASNQLCAETDAERRCQAGNAAFDEPQFVANPGSVRFGHRNRATETDEKVSSIQV